MSLIVRGEMERHEITTPFGRRAMSLGMLASQRRAGQCPKGASVDKWRIFRAACEAKDALGLNERALSVLNALLTFFPGSELSGEGTLVVFPSNYELALRAHGMAPATLRRHLAALVNQGIVVRRDSPNGKRYARKGRGGEIAEAFGFDLRPLVARATEIQDLASAASAARLAQKRLREAVTLLRRDAAKLIEAGIDAGICADWSGMRAEFAVILRALPRHPEPADLVTAQRSLAELTGCILKCLEPVTNFKETSGNESQNERHKQNSNPNPPIELEPGFRKSTGPKAEANQRSEYSPATPQEDDKEFGEANALKITDLPADLERKGGAEPFTGSLVSTRGRSGRVGETPAGLRAYPLGLVLQACPDICDYRTGGISDWRDLMTAAVTVRSTLGISPSAYEDAAHVMGQENAAVVVAAILQRAHLINSAGGYLRALTDKARRDEFSLGPVLMALVNKDHEAKGRSSRGSAA